MKKIFQTILIVVAWFPAKVRSQEEFIPAPAKLLSSLPFNMLQGGIIVVHACLAGHKDSLNFIFDTGCGGISLDSSTCDRLHLVPILSDKTIRGIAGIRQVRFVYGQQLQFPFFTADSLDFHVNDYDMISSVYGERIDGIIGYSFLKRYIVRIDYDSSKLYVYSKGYIKYPKGGFLLKPAMVTLPVQAARVRDDKSIDSRFFFDTGAGLCLLLSSGFVNDSSLMHPKSKLYNIQAEGLGGKTGMQLTTMAELKIGPYRFHNVPTCIFDDENNVTAYPSLGGLIGNDILRRFNIILNYEKGDIYLFPNTHFRDQFDYSYTGLEMYLSEGEIRISDVMKGSPAEKAGFKPEDVVIAVGDNYSRNLQTWKSLFQNTGEKVEVIIRRNTSVARLTLKVKSIY